MPAIFSFFFGKTGAGAGKAELRTIVFALLQLCQPLPAHGAPTRSCKLDLLLTGLKSCLLGSFQSTPGGFLVRASHVIAFADEGGHTPPEQGPKRPAPRAAGAEEPGAPSGRGRRARRPERQGPKRPAARAAGAEEPGGPGGRGRSARRPRPRPRQGGGPEGGGGRAAAWRNGTKERRPGATTRIASVLSRPNYRNAAGKAFLHEAKPAHLPPFYRQNRYIYRPSDPNGQKTEPNGQKY